MLITMMPFTYDAKHSYYKYWNRHWNRRRCWSMCERIYVRIFLRHCGSFLWELHRFILVGRLLSLHWWNCLGCRCFLIHLYLQLWTHLVGTSAILVTCWWGRAHSGCEDWAVCQDSTWDCGECDGWCLLCLCGYQTMLQYSIIWVSYERPCNSVHLSHCVLLQPSILPFSWEIGDGPSTSRK
jgi:hypothetical protein